MIRYTIKRLLLAVPTLFIMLTAIFVLVRLVPGDAAAVILGDQATETSLRALRAELGIDRPVHVQYVSFLGDVLTGNLGQSLSSGRSVIQEVLLVLPYTIELTLASIVIGIVLGLPLGIATAVNRNGWTDYIGRMVSLVGLSFPAFVSGILLLIVFAIQLGWFPVLNSGGSGDLVERLRNLALPALNLGIIMMAYVVRVTTCEGRPSGAAHPPTCFAKRAYSDHYCCRSLLRHPHRQFGADRDHLQPSWTGQADPRGA
jgi:ABC-type dipeptide/oligopeptide/nickel transport system permease component